MRFKVTLLTLGCLLFTNLTWAAEVYLKNGDKLTGEIISDSLYRLVIDTEAMGEVVIDKDYIKEFKTEEQLLAEAQAKEEKPAIEWIRKAAVAYTQKGGNDEQSTGSVDLFANRRTSDDEATFKASAYIDGDDGKTDTKKYYGMLRYANSFGDEKKWFRFGRLEGSKDNSSNVDYRITPSYGLGYWVSDEPDFKLRIDGALGWEYTKYEDGTSSEGEVVLTPSAHLEKTFANDMRFIQDIILYPSLEDTGEFRLRSESALTGRITDEISWRLSYIDDYDSDPKGGKKKNDYIIATGLEYAF